MTLATLPLVLREAVAVTGKVGVVSTMLSMASVTRLVDVPGGARESTSQGCVCGSQVPSGHTRQSGLAARAATTLLTRSGLRLLGESDRVTPRVAPA